MVSGYFVIQKFFEFFFRHGVVLRLLPTDQGFVQVGILFLSANNRCPIYKFKFIVFLLFGGIRQAGTTA